MIAHAAQAQPLVGRQRERSTRMPHFSCARRPLRRDPYHRIGVTTEERFVFADLSDAFARYHDDRMELPLFHRVTIHRVPDLGLLCQAFEKVFADMRLEQHAAFLCHERDPFGNSV